MTPAIERIQLGLIVAPALDAPVAEELRDELGRVLAERYPSVEWDLRLMRDPLVIPPVHLTELVEATRERMLAEGWDLAVLVTDVPFRLARRCRRGGWRARTHVHPNRATHSAEEARRSPAFATA